MSYQEEEQVKLRRQLGKQAVALAMQGRWREAVATNKSIIESFPNNVDAHNRLGKAYMELGEYSQAKEAYSRAIELDPYNAIARKNLDRLSYLEKDVLRSGGDSHKVEPQHFIEETGKAGVVNLYHLAPREILARTIAGDRVYLKISGANLIVENGNGQYLGQVEPKHGQRLIKLIEGGNEYLAAIVSSTEDRVTVIIREVYQNPSQAGQLSFPSRGLERLRPYISSDRILRRGLELEEELEVESGFTIVGEEATGILPDESAVIEEDEANNEE